MVQVTESLQRAIKQIATKGDPITLIEVDDITGKSTLIESLALSKGVQDILGLRQGLEVPQTNIIVTDFSEIPKDCLVVTAKLHPGTADDLYDNNVCLGESLWIAFERSQRNNKKDFLIYFMDTLENLNEKLSY